MATARKPRTPVADDEIPEGWTREEWEDWQAGGEHYLDDELAQIRRRARAQDQAARAGYEAGRKEARPARPKPKKKPAGRKPARSRTARQVRRQITSPVAAARSGSLVGLLTASLAMILLYRLLVQADRVEGFLGGVTNAVRWLADPTKVIEFSAGG